MLECCCCFWNMYHVLLWGHGGPALLRRSGLGCLGGQVWNRRSKIRNVCPPFPQLFWRYIFLSGMFVYVLLIVFSGAFIFCMGDFGAQRPPKRDAFGGNFGWFFWNARFHDFDDPYCRKPYFWEAGGFRNRSFFEVFFRSPFWEAFGEGFLRFWSILGSLGEPFWRHFGTF